MGAYIHDVAGTERAFLLSEKDRVDEEIRATKAAISAAKDRAYRLREFTNPRAFREMNLQLEHLKRESQEIQERLHALRVRERQANVIMNASIERHLRYLVRPVLGDDLYDALILEAEERAADELERAEQARSGKTLPRGGKPPIVRAELPEDAIADVLRERGWTCTPPEMER